MGTRKNSLELVFRPLIPKVWADFEQLFGLRGACGGCWCMLWRRPKKVFETEKGEGNRKAMKSIVESGEVPGILAFTNQKAIGWCALAPRSSYPALLRSKILKPVDDQECWSVSCLFIEKSFRNKGVATKLLVAAAEFALSQGAKIIEGYPVEPKAEKKIPAAFAWTGVPNAFLRAGFKEVARRSTTRPIMRLHLP